MQKMNTLLSLSHHAGPTLNRVALPVGGIGTGTVSVGGRGDLRDWEIINHTSKGFAPKPVFFATTILENGQPLDTRLLEGALPEEVYEGQSGSTVPLAGMPRFAEARCETLYPFIHVHLQDQQCPVQATLRAFNPLIPGDVEGSGWPVAVFDVTLSNSTAKSLEAAVVFACENFLGTDGIDTVSCTKFNQTMKSSTLQGVLFQAEGWPKDCELAGDFTLAVEKRGATSASPAILASSWGNDIRFFWETFAQSGAVKAPARDAKTRPFGSVCVRSKLGPRASVTFRFYLAWRFPNRLSWSSDSAKGPKARVPVGNYYARLGETSWSLLQKFVPQVAELERRTLAFSETFARAEIPTVIKEAALATLTALRTQTLFRTADGRFFGYEGGHRNKFVGGTLGSCTHVWGYDLASSFLFPQIARSFRQLQFGELQHPDGAIAFRAGLPLSRARRFQNGKCAADGHLAAIIGFHRDWLMQADDPWFAETWPRVKKAMRFCWKPGSWDADDDGVMENCQHNTMDVDYYGPNPQIQSLYVTALRACAQLARAYQDELFAQRCEKQAQRGEAFLNTKLFNGEYFIQQIPPSVADWKIDPRLSTAAIPKQGKPDFQIGEGVLIDQMLGGLHARVCGLAEPADTDKVRRALRAVVQYNFQSPLQNLSNHMRSYALGKESATIMASWPRGGRPKIPFPYYPEVMTGFEHVLAAHLLYQGEEQLALKVLTALRARYTGSQRNPFNEAEWGHHYARALASWGSVWAWTGQYHCSATGRLRFRDPGKKTTWFWALGNAWGRITVTPGKRQRKISLQVQHGTLHVQRLEVGAFVHEFAAMQSVKAGGELNAVCAEQVLPEKASRRDAVQSSSRKD